jgi:endonuclease G
VSIRLRISGLLLGFTLFVAVPADAFDAPRAVARLQQLGVAKKLSLKASRHLAFGMPSKASRSNDNDFLLVRTGYVISYNASRNAMNWASWAVEKDDLGTSGRDEHFRPDATLPVRFYKPNSGDYKIPGYSRGHMIRSGERTSSSRENRKTFVFTNMLPQAVNNNAGPWNHFEDFYREEVKNNGLSAHVIAGGIFGQSPVEQRGVAVPSSTWKVVALLKPGQTIEQVDEHTRVVAINIPNNNDDVKVEHDWGRYRTSIAEIEKQTGLHLFDELPAALAQRIKTSVDKGDVPAPLPKEYTKHNYGTDIQGHVTSIAAKQQAGVVKWYDNDKKYGFITLPDGNDVYVHANGRKTSIARGEQVVFDIAVGPDGRRFAVEVESKHGLAVPKNLQLRTAPAAQNAQP